MEIQCLKHPGYYGESNGSSASQHVNLMNSLTWIKLAFRQMKDSLVERITITVPLDALDEDIVLSLSDIVKENPGPPKSISLPEGMSLIYSFYTTLVPEFSPADAVTTCTWSSSDPTVVSVDNSGTVRALKKSGEAVITVRTENGLTAECCITAVDSALDIPADDIKAAFNDIWRLENYTLKLF